MYYKLKDISSIKVVKALKLVDKIYINNYDKYVSKEMFFDSNWCETDKQLIATSKNFFFNCTCKGYIKFWSTLQALYWN